jgi:hypothetical protein
MTMETGRTAVRWKNWLDEYGVGIYRHCCEGQSSQWYRPHEDCKMRFLGSPFCAVCQEAIIDRIYQLVSPIDDYLPESPQLEFTGAALDFSVALQAPAPSALHSRWLLNGRLLTEDSLQIAVDGNDLDLPVNRLVYEVIDETPLSRTYQFPQGYLFQIEWTILADDATPVDPMPGVSRLAYRVYPNPGSDVLYVECEADRPLPGLRLRLFDAAGRLVFDRPAALAAGRQTLSFDLSRLPAGMYAAVLDLGDYRESFQVVRK